MVQRNLVKKMSKNFKLSFVDDMEDDDDEPLAPINKAQAPPPLYINQKAEEDRAISYSGDSLQQLKASQKLSAPKPVEVELNEVVEEIILTGEEAEKAMEIAEENETPQPSAKVLGQTWQETQILLEGKKAAKSLLKGADKERIFLSAHQEAAEKKTYMQHDLNDQDMDWEEEIMQRGIISSKPVAEVIAEVRSDVESKSMSKRAKDDFDFPKPRNSVGHGSRVFASPDVCIEDIIQNVRTALANVQENIRHNETRLSELHVQKGLIRAPDTNSIQFDQMAKRFNSFQESKSYLKHMVYMLRSKQMGIAELVRSIGETLEGWVENKVQALKKWQEERVLAVKQVGELESIVDYQPAHALLAPSMAPVPLNPPPSVYVSSLQQFLSIPTDVLPLVREGRYEEAACMHEEDPAVFVGHITTVLALRMISPNLASNSVTPPVLSLFTPLSDLQRVYEEVIGDVAEDMLSIPTLLQNLIVLYDSIGREKFEEAHMHLSVLQLLNPLLTLFLSHSLLTHTQHLATSTRVLTDFEHFIERVGGGKTDPGLGWGAEVRGELFLNPLLPFCKHVLCSLNLFHHEECAAYVRFQADYLEMLPETEGEGEDDMEEGKETFRSTFISRWSDCFSSLILRVSSSICLPICAISASSPDSADEPAQGEGRWKGMGRSVMLHQLVLLTTLWRNAYLFRDLCDERTRETLVAAVRKAMLEKALGAVVKCLVSSDNKCLGLALRWLNVVIGWMELRASTLARASILQSKVDQVQEALQLHGNVEKSAITAKALVSHLQSSRA
eukprot:gene25578-30885_t